MVGTGWVRVTVVRRHNCISFFAEIDAAPTAVSTHLQSWVVKCQVI